VGVVRPVEPALGEITKALSDCSHDMPRSRARKMADQERFHTLFVEGWSNLLCSDVDEVSDAFNAAVRRV
jgi:hypothetical protein